MAEGPATTVEPAREPQAPGQIGDRRAVSEARRSMQGMNFQQMFAENPLGAFFMLILGLTGMLGRDNLMGGGINRLLGSTFGVDNPRALIEGLGAPARIGEVTVGDRQQAVNANIQQAAHVAGISPELLGGVWGIESRFGTHNTLVSSTGCAGDFQFSRGTFRDMIEKHGARIAELAGDQISPEVRDALRAGNWRVQTEWGSDLRFHPAVSTYASAFYLREVADGLGVDPKNQQNFGVIFAGYNVGPGNADRLRDLHEAGSSRAASASLGSAASNNPLFYRGGASATEALSRYQSYVETRIADFRQNFGAPAPTQEQIAEERPASAVRTSFARELEGNGGQQIAASFNGQASGEQQPAVQVADISTPRIDPAAPVPGRA